VFKEAADIIRHAEVFIITVGAGMGVDSGLPDFRGDTGFWKGYPAYARLVLTFIEAANLRESEIIAPHISIPCKALESLTGLNKQLFYPPHL